MRFVDEAILRNMNTLMIYSLVQCSMNVLKLNGVCFFNLQEILQKIIKISGLSWTVSCTCSSKNIMELLGILRVLRSETWLTVYRALYMNRRIGGSPSWRVTCRIGIPPPQGVIPKHSRRAKGCSGQRLSGLRPRKTFLNIFNCKLNFPNVLIKFTNAIF